MRTYKSELMRLYKNAGACDKVNFNENIQMIANEDYEFSKEFQMKEKMNNERFALRDYMDSMTEYAQGQQKIVVKNTHNYRFKKALVDSDDEDEENVTFLNNKDRFLKSSFGKSKEKYDLMTADLKFDMTAVNEKYVKKSEKVKKEIKSFISLKSISMIGTQEFVDDYAHVEEYYDILADLKVENPKNEVKDKELVDYLTQKVSIKYGLRELKKGIETHIRSEGFDVQYTRDLSLHPEMYHYDIPKVSMERKKSVIVVDGDVSKENMLEVAARVHRVPQLQAYIKKISQEQKNMTNIEIDNQLEARMEEIKAKIKIYKDKRKEKKEIKTIHNETQTQKIIFQEDIKDILELSDKLLIGKIQKITHIKEAEILSGKNPHVVYMELNPILNQYLYHLLLIIAAGEEFISWSNYMLSENEKEVEKDVLSTLYNNLYLIDNKCSASGINKMQLLSFYSTNKIKIQKEGIPEPSPYARRVLAKTLKTQQKQPNPVQLNKTLKSTQKMNNSLMASSTKNMKAFLRSTKNFNETTKQNTSNFNFTRKSVNENIENKIDRLFRNENEPMSSKRNSLSPMISKPTWGRVLKGSRNPFAKSITPRK